MIFKKLDLVGFKSFVDKTTFVIEKGLTGIVGPNGCGKSNIVESIRWCMGETSAKSMRGSGMEDVIFAGTANKTSKNIAEVTLTLDNSEKNGPLQYKELDIINIKRRITKDKGSRYFLNDKEVRARDVQTLFADLSTGAHSPSMISQGRIGALVTAKPTDRRAILEEAAGISGIHVRRHESELRLNSAENNLKRADELRRQQERQLENLRKQAIEASKYKTISEEIKKIESGLYYIKLMEIEKEIETTKNVTGESDKEINNLKDFISQKNEILEKANLKLKPLRDKNMEILSKLQRLNLEFTNLEDEEKRIKSEKDRLIKSQSTLTEDIEREKNIILEATSNEKRLKEEKNELIEIDSKYYDTEKKSSEDLNVTKNRLTAEIDKIKGLVNAQKNDEAISVLDNFKTIIEVYADSYSKNQNIKNESIKRKERISAIDTEIESWKNLKFNSEKMSKDLEERIGKVKIDLDNTAKLPEEIAEKKGRLTQNTSDTENKKQELSDDLLKAEDEQQIANKELKEIEQRMMLARENKARSGATLEGLENRKKDLANALRNDLNINSKDLLNNSDLKNLDNLPSAIEQEDKLDSKKNEREKLGSVNLRADEETKEYKTTIQKMEKDREDLITAIAKLRNSISELNQKGRERLVEAFDKVNKKFNEVYTKLFSGGNAKLELVDSEDPLEAGLELLVSPPGKRLQSISLLSGGEQALTALSLIFAVFLTSPSPICVLDEVDAPLDDANVTRFCALLEELTKITETKFIIITHHALTMSRMDRLYGVTMADKGISQLVSVDLQKAEGLVA
jgi:chromosome segregation protein